MRTDAAGNVRERKGVTANIADRPQARVQDLEQSSHGRRGRFDVGRGRLARDRF